MIKIELTEAETKLLTHFLRELDEYQCNAGCNDLCLIEDCRLTRKECKEIVRKINSMRMKEDKLNLNDTLVTDGEALQIIQDKLMKQYDS